MSVEYEAAAPGDELPMVFLKLATRELLIPVGDDGRRLAAS